MHRRQLRPDRYRPLRRRRLSAERRDPAFCQRKLPRGGQARLRATSPSRAAATRPQPRGPCSRPASSTTPGTCSSTRRSWPDMESQGLGEVISAFGTSVERLHLNQTNPDPSLPPEERSVYIPVEEGNPQAGNEPASGPDRSGRRACALEGDRPAASRRYRLRRGRPGHLQRPAGARTLRLDCERRLSDAGHRRGEAHPRRGRLDRHERQRHPRQGRGRAVGHLPDLDQRRPSGHSRR